MLEEISLKSPTKEDYLNRATVETIYFGGGTPSLLTNEELSSLLAGIYRNYEVANDVEITLETNPDDINPNRLLDWKDAGINRLSIGVQSFFDEDLLWMNRAHHAGQALQCLREAKAAGFFNLNIDLIYGVPGMTNGKWAHNLQQAIDEEIPHLSCYALTVEPSTALDKMIRAHKVHNVDAEQQAAQFLYLSERLRNAGYEHYEISNFSLPGKRSRHNTSYWQGKHYMGVGPSAHSFNGVSRQWNVSNNSLYLESMQKGILPFDIELLTTSQQKNEYIMTALRTMEGIDLRHVVATFGEEESRRLLMFAEPYQSNKKIIFAGDALILSEEGRLFADGIASALFID